MLNVSIVIPVYNSHYTIFDCLDSVLKQDFKNYEIIMIDDGSTDDSVDIINACLCGYDVQYTLIKQENHGPSFARNVGIKYSKYDIIAFLDSDDIWAPWHLADLLKNYLECSGYPIVSCSKGDFSKKPGYTIINFKKLLYKNYILSSCMIVKKNILEKYCFPESQKYSEDYKLWVDIASSGNNFLLLAQCSARANPKKAAYNIKGLSENFWQMEYAVLSEYKYLLDKHKITIIRYIIICVFSLSKYIYRVINKII